MLFLAATNDRNHAVSPTTNIKLRPYSILYYFVYSASYLVLSMMFFGLWWTTSWTTILSCYSSNHGRHPFPCFQTWDGCLPRFHDWHKLIFLTHQTCSEASFYTSLFCLIFWFCLCCSLAYDEQSHEQLFCHVTHQTIGHIHSYAFKHGMDVSHGSMTDMNLFFSHIKLVLRPHSILHCFASYLVCLCCFLAYDEQPHEQLFCHVTHQTVGHIHCHAFKHGMDVSHGSMIDMNLFFLHNKIVLRPHSILHYFASYLFVYVILWPMMNYNLWGNGICYLCFSCYLSNRERHPCPCFETWVDVSHGSMGDMILFFLHIKLF
jgi:hypothetical protein